MKTQLSAFLAAAIFCVLTVESVHGTDTILHSFSGTTTDGGLPFGSLSLSGSTLYGMTNVGGSAGNGVVFSENTNGTGFTVLHSFMGGATDGSSPWGSLVLSGSTLYGMTERGGASGGGLAFSMNSNGTGFTDIHDFAGNPDGTAPRGGLTLSGSTLFGMTRNGGSGFGAIFSMNTSGVGYTVLHRFSFADGAQPFGSLTLSGTTLYGMTNNFGPSSGGTIFKMNTDGTGFSVLYAFDGISGTGVSGPLGSLTISGSTLYGTTYNGGANNRGTVFSVSTSGTNFTVLHSFGGTNDTIRPQASLVLFGSTLFGTSYSLGPNGGGNVFSIKSDGTGYTSLQDFGQTGDGSSPDGDVTLSPDASTLYGMTSGGGFNNGNNGTVFSAPTGVPEPSTAIMILAGCAAVSLRRRRVGRAI